MQNGFLFAIIFLYGIVIGSFLNVLIYRIPRGLGISKGRSMCTNCSHTLVWYDLVPFFSYLFLKGKCRYCGSKISFRYPFVELLNGILYILVVWKYGVSFLSLGWLIAIPALICVAFIDAEHKIIPDRFHIVLICAALIMAISERGPDIVTRLIGGFAVSVPFLLIAYISGGRAMGGGDIKLMAAAGLCLGWQLCLVALFLGAIIGSIVSVIQMIGKQVNRKSQVPFGPYLAIGIVAAGLAGDAILRFYLELFM